jgi:hypothetical protein
MSIPVTSLFSYVFFGEILTWTECAGAMLIFLTIILVTIAKSWKQRKTEIEMMKGKIDKNVDDLNNFVDGEETELLIGETEEKISKETCCCE